MHRHLLALLLTLTPLAALAQPDPPPRRVRPFDIPSGSMIPTLEIGDYVMADLAEPGAIPARGDVIVFRLPRDPTQFWIKRVVALEGDRVAMQDGVLILNGTAVPRRDEGVAVVEEDPAHGITREVHRYTETLPGGRTFSIVKQTGAGPMNNVAERTVPAGTVFVLGDNRDNSMDSRVADMSAPVAVGYIPLENLTGTVHSIYWSRTRARVGRTVE